MGRQGGGKSDRRAADAAERARPHRRMSADNEIAVVEVGEEVTPPCHAMSAHFSPAQAGQGKQRKLWRPLKDSDDSSLALGKEQMTRNVSRGDGGQCAMSDTRRADI